MHVLRFYLVSSAKVVEDVDYKIEYGPNLGLNKHDMDTLTNSAVQLEDILTVEDTLPVKDTVPLEYT